MPKTPRVPAYSHHKAKNLAYVRLNGRAIYLGRWNSLESRQAYDRQIAEWLARNRQAPPPPPTATTGSGLTVTELVAQFVQHAEARYQKHGKPTGTADNYVPALRELRRLYGDTPAAEFSPKRLKAVRQIWIESGCSRRYVNDQAKRIQYVFRWAASEELVPATVPMALNTVGGLRAGESKAIDRAPVEPVSDGDVTAALAHLPRVVADMVRLQQLCGMRSGEVVQLRPADVDRTGDVWRYTPARHKTQHHGKARVVFLGPQAQVILTPYLLRPAEEFCFSPAESEKQRREERHAKRVTPLSCGNIPSSGKSRRRRPPKESYTNDSYRRAVARACQQAGIKPWHPHQLRHAAATVIREHFGLEHAQAALGHATLAATQIYAVKNLALGEHVARKLG